MNKKHDLNASILFRNVQTSRFLGLLVYAPYPPSRITAQHPPQKKKPKLLFHASKEKIVHCKPAFLKGYESKFIVIAEAHADRVWSLNQEPSDFFPKNKERKIPQGYQFL